MQYGGGQTVWWRVFSMEERHPQYSAGCAASMDLSHHQYGGGSAVQNLSGKNDILQTILLLPRFHPTVVESRCLLRSL